MAAFQAAKETIAREKAAYGEMKRKEFGLKMKTDVANKLRDAVAAKAAAASTTAAPSTAPPSTPSQASKGEDHVTDVAAKEAVTTTDEVTPKDK